jgi:hypothetical protein
MILMNAVKLPSRARAVATRALRLRIALVGLLLWTLGSCVSTGRVEVGMDEKAWRRTAVEPVLVGQAESGEKVWKSGDSYYHFRDGKLTRISGGNREVEITLEP